KPGMACASAPSAAKSFTTYPHRLLKKAGYYVSITARIQIVINQIVIATSQPVQRVQTYRLRLEKEACRTALARRL
ncbi:hypothetical protein, partial [Erwinia sp.]|uniref:hypothetical protein n=1 Tax=Erwinia citreus TaxID=558 RepID=UPI0028A196C1